VDLHDGHLLGGVLRFAFHSCLHFEHVWTVGASSHLYVPHAGHLHGESYVDIHPCPHLVQCLVSDSFIHMVDLQEGQFLGIFPGSLGTHS
jgi:hypothetical protein